MSRRDLKLVVKTEAVRLWYVLASLASVALALGAGRRWH